MCCRTLVAPVPPEPTLSLILKIAGFLPESTGWRRKHEEGEILVTAERGGLLIRLSPGIGLHAAEEHLANAGRAAILFKLAMTLAEQADGRLEQEALRDDCIEDAGYLPGTMDGVLHLAHYPDHPLRFESLCLGFRRVLWKGVGQEERNPA